MVQAVSHGYCDKEHIGCCCELIHKTDRISFLKCRDMLFSSVHDCKLITLPKITNASGNLTAINGLIDVPFEIKRVYYLYDVPGGESRGGHAHRSLIQLVVAAGG